LFRGHLNSPQRIKIRWLPNGRRAAIDEKMRHFFPSSPKEVTYIDEVIEGDPRRLRVRLGVVRLKIGEEIILVQNNQSFEEAFKKGEINIQAPVILLPNGKRAVVGQGKIRQFLSADPDKEIEIRWDHKTKVSSGVIVPEDPLTDDMVDLAKETENYDPDEISIEPEHIGPHPKETIVERDSREQTQQTESSATEEEDHRRSVEEILKD
jgi:hypothetical protein